MAESPATPSAPRSSGAPPGTIANAGYHTVALGSLGATLTKGESFSVVVKLTTPVPPPKTTGEVVIGANGDTDDDPFKGHIDDVRICAVALQPADICALAGGAWNGISKQCL